jgi:hypothetical protein
MGLFDSCLVLKGKKEGSFVKKLESKADACLAQSRRVRKEKQRRMLAKCFNMSGEKFLESNSCLS